MRVRTDPSGCEVEKRGAFGRVLVRSRRAGEGWSGGESDDGVSDRERGRSGRASVIESDVPSLPPESEIRRLSSVR